MPEEVKKPVRYDVEGYEIVTDAIGDLLNQYPGLEGLTVKFSTLEEDGGLAWFPITGAAIDSETESITGKVRQTCNYPFYIIFRNGAPSADRKKVIKEFLDNLGRWLERQTVTIEETNYTLEAYPELTGNRKITEISRQTPGYLDSVLDNGVENWAIYIAVKYTNEFYK